MAASSIYRFNLKLTDYQEISLPTSHEVLSVAPARDTYDFGDGRKTFGIDLWARVSKSHHNKAIGIWVIGTGHPYPEEFDLSFVGTAVMQNKLVWHVFKGEAQSGR